MKLNALRWLTNLKTLDCSDNHISSVSALEGMPVLNANALNFNFYGVTNISALKMLTTRVR